MNCEHYRSEEKNHVFKRGKTATNRILVQITNNAIKVLTQPGPGARARRRSGVEDCLYAAQWVEDMIRSQAASATLVRRRQIYTGCKLSWGLLAVALAVHWTLCMVRQRLLRDQHKDEVVPLRACFHPSCSLLSPKEWQSFTWVTISNSKKNQRLVSSVKKTRSGEREFCETSWLKGARETVQDPDLAPRPLLMVWEFTSALLP